MALFARLAITLFCYPENEGKIPLPGVKWVITRYLWVISGITLKFPSVNGKIEGKVRVKVIIVSYSTARAIQPC